MRDEAHILGAHRQHGRRAKRPAHTLTPRANARRTPRRIQSPRPAPSTPRAALGLSSPRRPTTLPLPSLPQPTTLHTSRPKHITVLDLAHEPFTPSPSTQQPHSPRPMSDPLQTAAMTSPTSPWRGAQLLSPVATPPKIASPRTPASPSQLLPSPPKIPSPHTQRAVRELRAARGDLPPMPPMQSPLPPVQPPPRSPRLTWGGKQLSLSRDSVEQYRRGHVLVFATA